MLLDKQISIIVFQVDDDTFEQIGEVQYTSLIWPDAYNGYDNFELWAPINEENASFIKRGNVIWTGGENAAVIEIVKSTVDNKGTKTYNVKGRTLEKYCSDRTIWGTYIARNMRASTLMYGLVYTQMINPTNEDRIFNWLVNAEDTEIGKMIETYQKTGGDLYETLTTLASESDLGFSILFDPYNKRLVFEVREGIDRTENNLDDNEPVVFSTELEDILSSSYYSNDQDEKNVALVQGEDKDVNRRSIAVGNVKAKGFKRKELYVDARDLQSEVQNEDGSTTQMSIKEYDEILTQRGEEKLSEYPLVETFEAQIRQFGDVQYEYGKDYFKGDKVTIIDEELDISVSARITKVEEDFSEQYALVLTFGYSYPTSLQKVKRMIS